MDAIRVMETVEGGNGHKNYLSVLMLAMVKAVAIAGTNQTNPSAWKEDIAGKALSFFAGINRDVTTRLASTLLRAAARVMPKPPPELAQESYQSWWMAHVDLTGSPKEVVERLRSGLVDVSKVPLTFPEGKVIMEISPLDVLSAVAADTNRVRMHDIKKAATSLTRGDPPLPYNAIVFVTYSLPHGSVTRVVANGFFRDREARSRFPFMQIADSGIGQVRDDDAFRRWLKAKQGGE